MCPVCMTNAALVVAGATSGAGALGFVAMKIRALRRPRRQSNREQGEKREPEQR